MTRGLYLDPETHDLVIENGSPVRVSGEAAVAQSIKHRLLFFKGEYFLDVRQGMPWRTQILIKNPDLSQLRDLFRQAILQDPEVVDVPSVDLSLDGRTLSVSWTARLTTGRTITSDDYTTFILDL